MADDRRLDDAIEKQFHLVLDLLKDDSYRYLLTSEAVRVLFKHKRIEIVRRLGNPIFKIAYDAIDHLEGLHSELAAQRAIQASSPIDTAPPR